MTQEVRIPDIGDIDQVEVIEICVAVGDQVGPQDALIVIESDKASMEVPAGIAGTIASVDVSLGDEVGEGALVVTLETAAGEGAAERDTEEPAADAATPAQPAEEATEEATEDTMETAATVATPIAAEPDASRMEPAAGDAAEPVEVRVPDIGEATNVVVIEIAVAVGDQVAADDLLVVVESDKASMEIPAGQAGTITALAVSVGTEVEEGTLLATISAEGAAEGAAESASVSPARPADQPTAPAARPVAAQPKPAPTEAVAAPASAPTDAEAGGRVYAGPAVRRLARELGVQLADVKGSGSRGRIVKDDVKAFVKSTLKQGAGAGAAAGGAGIPAIPAVDFSRFGEVELQPLSRVRAAGAVNLHRSWLNLPHVTQFEEADVTELEAFRKTLKEEAARRDVKITPLAFIIKACCYALQAFPTFNASLDPEAKNFILKKYYHIGFAVDTPEGLVVPVIRNADKMGVWELSAAVADLAEKARTQSLGMTDMQGGSFSISSLGGIGGTGFTPIINAPEVAILGVSRLVTRPVWNGGEFKPREMLPLSLSYDHRAVNGAEAGRFVALLAELLGDIRRLSL